MEQQQHNIGGRMCRLYSVGTPQTLLVQVVSPMQQGELEAEVELIAAAGVPFTFVAVPIEDWELELMPWAEPAVSKRPEVGTGTGATLRYITDELLPTLPALPVTLGGYSLGGLFSLWAARQTDRFPSVAAASPSLWAGDWPVYAAAHQMKARHVYLSLGDREERSRNNVMARVGERIREEYSLLQQQLGADNTTLVWEQGGHFANPAARMARAFVWCLKHTA